MLELSRMAATAGTACTCGTAEYCDPVQGCQLCSWVASSYQEILCPCDASRDAVIGCTPEVKEGGNLCRNRSEALEECSRRGYTPDHSTHATTSAGCTTTTRQTTASLTANGALLSSAAILQTPTAAALAGTRAAEWHSAPLPVRQDLPGGSVIVFLLTLLVLMMVFVSIYRCQKSRQMKRLYGYTPDHSPRATTSAGCTTTTRPTTNALTANGALLSSAAILQTPTAAALAGTRAAEWHSAPLPIRQDLPGANHEALPFAELGAIGRNPLGRFVNGNESASTLSGFHHGLEVS